MDQGIAIVIGAIIGAVVSGVIAYFTSKANLKAVERTANSTIELQSKALIADLKRTEQELKVNIGIKVLSKNRQEWINDLRKTINDTYYLIDITTIKLKNSIQSGMIGKFLIEEIQDNIYQVRKIKNYLELLLNPKEESYEQITEAIELTPYNLQKIFDTAVKYSNKKIVMDNAITIINTHINEIDSLKKRILESTQRVLKEEWERVKKGE